MKKEDKEKMRWLWAFMVLYEKAAPLVRHITNLEADDLPVSPNTLMESTITLRPIWEAVRKMPQPREKDLRAIEREFEIVLSNCIKAGELAARYTELGGYGMDTRTYLGKIINSIVLAHEYMESLSKRVNSLVDLVLRQ